MIHVRHLFISPGHNFFGHHQQPPGGHRTVAVNQIECVAGQGILGDRFFGFKKSYKGQITFFSMEVFDALRRELRLPAAQPSATRRNVFVSGLDLNTLVAKEFEIQGVRFTGAEECRPCYWMNSALGSGAEEWLKGRGGLRAQILTDGVLRCDPEPLDFSAVILAGGKSHRMGFDKAGLEMDGQSLLARAVARLRETGAREIFISGRCDRDDTSLGCPVLLDREPGLGPVAGIERALHAATFPLVLVLAVDLPYVTTDFLRRLVGGCDSLTGVVLEWNGELEPLVAVYPKACQGMAAEFLTTGRRAARDFAQACLRENAVRVIPADPDYAGCFVNWNAPGDARPTGDSVGPAAVQLQSL